MHRRWVVIFMFPLFFHGCLVDLKERGTEIDPLLLGQLQPSSSTKADVLRVLGVPTRNTVIQDHEAWVYDYSLEKHSVLFLGIYNEERRTMRQRGVAILFADDRLYDYIFME